MYRYELHMHSREASACAHSSIHDMIRSYQDLGYAGAAVTNHFIAGNTCINRRLPWAEFVNQYSRAYYEGLDTAAKLDFDLLFGVEQAYDTGKEFLVYGFEPDFLVRHPELRDGSAGDWSRAVREIGGFFAYAHPFRQRDYIPDGRTMPDMSLADGVEVYNFCNDPADNAEAARVFGGTDKVIIAGSDLHKAGFANAYGVDLPRRVHTSAQLAEVLRARDFTLWLGK